MEDKFEKLKMKGNNSVDDLVQWLKHSKVVENTKAAEEKASKLFSDVVDKSNVEFPKFMEALQKLAKEQKKIVEELAKTLAAEGPRVQDAFAARVFPSLSLKGKK